MARILFATFGSHGDLNPYRAIGLELQRRGHRVTIATSEMYRAGVEAEGLGFHAVRPDISLDDRELMVKMFDPRTGSELVLSFFARCVRDSYEDTLPAARNADLMVTQILAFGAVAAAEKLRMPWVSSVLAPSMFLSAYDPPVPAPAPWCVKLRVFGPGIMRFIFNVGRKRTGRWVQPVTDFRRECGLSTAAHPLFEGLESPHLLLALFSRHLAAPARDWPSQVVVTGFPFYDRAAFPVELERFLNDGPAPLVFTLGSAAVGAAGNFYLESLEAVRRLGVRAILLTGSDPVGLPERLPDGVIAVPYASHAQVFRRASTIIHHGGIGTTGQAMRSGRPMLTVPIAHDQFDNGERARRTGAGEVLYRSRYTAARAGRALRMLLEKPCYAQAAAAAGERVRAEDGCAASADALEEYLAKSAWERPNR